MTVHHREYRNNALKLNSNCYSFDDCVFCKATTNWHYIYAYLYDFNYSFVSCLFFQINTEDYVLFVQGSIGATMDKCCFKEEISVTSMDSDQSFDPGIPLTV